MFFLNDVWKKLTSYVIDSVLLCHLNKKRLNCVFFAYFLDKPDILDEPTTIVNETDYVLLSREIVSNPLANVSWYNGSELLYTLIAERNATFIIKKAVCTDTKNFTLVASNTVKENVSALVELIVNCEYISLLRVTESGNGANFDLNISYKTTKS